MTGSDLHIQPILAASGIEFLVVLVIMAISAIYNWMQKKKGRDDWGDFNQPPTGPRTGPTSLEEELRRMLEGHDSPSPRTPTPPIIRQEPAAAPPVPPAPRPNWQQTSVPPPPPVHSTKMYRGHCEVCEGHIEFPSDLMGSDVHCPHCSQVTRLYPHTETVIERRRHQAQIADTRPLPGIHVQKEKLPAARKAATPTDPGQRQRSPEIKEVVSLLSQPRTARQAVIASLILSPPKALEDQP